MAPYRGMFARVDERLKELNKWISEREACALGPRFLRYRVIDMQGDMALEVGAFCESLPELRGGVTAGIMPGGRYATLTYSGLGWRQTSNSWAGSKTRAMKATEQVLRRGMLSRADTKRT